MVDRLDSSGNFHLNDSYQNDEEASQELHNNTSFGNVASGSQSSQDASNKSTLATEFYQQEGKLDTSNEAGPLGLTLKKTPSFLGLVEMILVPERDTKETNSSPERNHFVNHPKASNLPASFIKIGSWTRVARNEGDLVVKWYYAKRRMVWEILEMGLKSKIEMLWENILAIRATFRADEPGVLEIELKQPPAFFREKNPHPRKHTIWQQASDFTGGQAPKFRRHYVEFPPNTLDKQYQKLLEYDRHLFKLSQKPFPSLKSPCFDSDNVLSFVSKGYTGPQFPPQRPLSSIPSPYMVPPQHVHPFNPTIRPPFSVMDSGSPMSVIDFSSGGKKVHSHGFESQRTSRWGEGITNVVNYALETEDRICSLPSTSSATQTNSVFSCQDYNGFNCGDKVSALHPENVVLSSLEHHLLSDSNDVYSDERTLGARVRSMGSLLKPLDEAKPNTNIRPDQFGVDGRLLCPHPVQYLPPQVCQEDLTAQQWTNNSPYPQLFSPYPPQFYGFNGGRF